MKTPRKKLFDIVGNSGFLCRLTLFLCVILFSSTASAQKNDGQNSSDESLLDQYVSSKGKDIIVFDAKNIKQFWVDKTVVSRGNSFEIDTNNLKSVPLPVQLINISKVQDCSIEIITDTQDAGFSVINSKNKTLAQSTFQDDYINYRIISATFHLEDAPNFCFNLVFNSKTDQSIVVKKIVFSFSRNKNSSFLDLPGTLIPDQNLFSLSGVGGTEWSDKKDLVVTGYKSLLTSKKNILVSDRPITTTGTVKNTGDKPTHVSVGYGLYTSDGQKIHSRNIPYKNINKVLKVISSKENSNTITVDSYSDWRNGCYLVLNAKEDLSDFPNFSIVEEKIVDVKKLENGQAEITFEKPLKTPIKEGTSVRIHSPHGGTYLYICSKILQPGEEVSFDHSMKKDDSFLDYSPEAICKGTYYIVPVILSYSVNADDKNTISISNYKIGY